MKAVLPVAGLGTRLLPATKEQPKEMLPIFARTIKGELCVKPLIQLVFEQLFNEGVRNFIFVVGRGKRSVEDHFTPDMYYVNLLRNGGKEGLASELESFYGMVGQSTLMWVNQPEPKGFGHAVLMAEPLIGSSPFIVHAGDTYIQSRRKSHFERMLDVFRLAEADAVLLLSEAEDPRPYGVAEVKEEGGVFRVFRLVEKPRHPPSNLIILPVYIFQPVIFDALKTIPPGVGGEIQLTDGIQRLIDWRRKVLAVMLDDADRLDIGTPQTYWQAISYSYRLSVER